MAYARYVSPPLRTQVAGQQYLCFTITESEVGPTDEWIIESLPGFFTITLFEVSVSAGPAGQMVNPRLGTKQNWTPYSLDDVAESERPGPSVRMGCSIRVASPKNRLCGRSQPALTGTPATQVSTRVTIIEGH